MRSTGVLVYMSTAGPHALYPATGHFPIVFYAHV